MASSLLRRSRPQKTGHLWDQTSQASRVRGFSLLEVLLTTAAMIPLLTGIVFLLHRALTSDAIRTRIAAEQRAELRLVSLLENGVASLDFHRLPLWPRLHPHGAIQFVNGSANPIVHSGTFPPDPRSDAITFLAISATNQFRVRSSTPGSSTLILRACQANSLVPDPAATNRFVGVTASGVYELIGETIAIPSRPGCYDFNVTTSESMSLPSPMPTDPLAAVRIILPIAAHYTLYRDTSGKLRYLGHRGQENVENQPLSDTMPSITLQSTFTGGRLALTAQLQTSASPETTHKTFTFGHQLSRRNFFSLLEVREP